jgi:hypothetical protein
MSVDYSASLVVGVVLDQDDLYREVERRGCAHPIGDGVAFCPTCGQPRFVAVKEPIEGYEDEDKYHGFELSSLDYDSCIYVAGKSLGSVAGEYGLISVKVSLSDLEAALAELRGTPLETSPFGPVAVHLCMHVC